MCGYNCGYQSLFKKEIPAMKLTAIKIKAAKPKDKAYKLMDGAGLYLLINKSGRKYWRYNYRFTGKHKTLSIGIYPLSGTV